MAENPKDAGRGEETSADRSERTAPSRRCRKPPLSIHASGYVGLTTRLKSLVRELTVWSRFQHPNVLGLLGFYFDEAEFTTACAVTEWQQNGDILSYVQRLNADLNRRLELV